MSYYNQQQAPMAYPPPVTAYPAQPQGPYVAPPPPIGYPTKVDSGYPQDTAPKGCFAALCGCWVFHMRCC